MSRLTPSRIMKTWTKPGDNYVDITEDGNVIISCEQSRQLLGQIGIAGEILHTPGHSDHCVSLLLDDGSVFTGDLPPEAYAFDNPVALATWRLLRERGAARVYPAHGPARSIDETPSGTICHRGDDDPISTGRASRVHPVFGYDSAAITVLTSAITSRAGSLKLHNPSPTGFAQQGKCGGWVDWQERSSLVLRRISLNSFGYL